MPRRQHPPNDMSSRHMSSCRQNVGNVGPTLGKKMSSQPAKRHVDKTSSKILPTCRLILLDIKKKQQSFAENHTVMVWFGARKSQKWYHICVNSRIRTIFFLKNDHYLHWSDGTMSHGYGWAVVWWHISRHVTQPWIQSLHRWHLTGADF